ncbi:MAG: ATP-binding protein [Psychromonas sp.]|nr:ATP-binding protein [Alteromonadales bacterium]MCP5079851.1 ATP-binding protein [Psychromonas sp.]
MLLTLLRGLPGSGKSTLATQMDAIHLEADMYFVDKNGLYSFDPTQLKQAHSWCQSQCELHLKQRQSVVIANTFVKQWEMKVYRDLAKQYNAKLVIKTCTGKYQSIHNVPADTIKKMEKQWQV